MIVDINGSGDFTSIQSALDSIPENNTTPITIFIKNGIYEEKLYTSVPYISLIGENPSETIVTYSDYAKKELPDGSTYNTFNSYSAYFGGHDFYAENITFANASGCGSEVGQAIAVYADADKMMFKNCRFIGHQDTLFTGPLPTNPLPKGLNLLKPVLGFGREYTTPIRQYYQQCFIQGDVDFIFGSATAVFSECELFCNYRPGNEFSAYVAAPSTIPKSEFGYVFLDCYITGAADDDSVVLGRPWREHAKVSYIRCELDALIKKCGWNDWSSEERRNTATFEEFGNFGVGASNADRLSWVTASEETPESFVKYTLENIFKDWTPQEFK